MNGNIFYGKNFFLNPSFEDKGAEVAGANHEHAGGFRFCHARILALLEESVRGFAWHVRNLEERAQAFRWTPRGAIGPLSFALGAKFTPQVSKKNLSPLL